jgi:tetratricopeptide (TPR) repeat protein
MNSPLPHFGVVVDELCDCLQLEETIGDVPKSVAVLSERTKRTISTGQPVKQKTWEEYSTELVHVLVSSPMFLFHEDDRDRLSKAFHSYRQSYEQFNDAMSGIRSDQVVLWRSVVRLLVFDVAIRNAAFCIKAGITPNEESPRWANSDGGNKFWRNLLEQRFPRLTLMDSGKPNGDCASRLKMNSAKMKRSLYENDFPGLKTLQGACPGEKELAASLRHYAAFKLFRKLAHEFGESETQYWASKFARVTKWFHSFLEPLPGRLAQSDCDRLLARVIVGGVRDEMVQGMINRFLETQIPPVWREDLLAISRNKPIEAIKSYIEFCNHYDAPPDGACWEQAYEDYQAEMIVFAQTGAMPNDARPSDKLRFSQMLAKADNPAEQEHILRQIIGIDTNDPEVHQLLAQLLEEWKRFAEACEEFEKAAALHTDFVLPLYRLADLRSRCGQHEDALRTLARIPGHGLGAGSREFLFGVVLLRAGKPEEAIHNLEAAFRAGWEPGSSSVLLIHAHQKILESNPKSLREIRQWEKHARHHGGNAIEVLKKYRIP